MATLSHNETLEVFIYVLMEFSAAAARQNCTVLQSVNATCDTTPFPESCCDSLFPLIGPNTTQPQVIYNQSAHIARNEVSRTSLDFAENGKVEQFIISIMPNNRSGTLIALQKCRVFFDLASDDLNCLSSETEISSSETRDSIIMWLTASNDYLESCRHGFDGFSYDVRDLVTGKLKKSAEYIGISLAIITEIDQCASSNEN